MESKVTTPVVKGLLISLALIVLGLALHFSGNSMNQGLSSLQYLVLGGGIIWGCINYANQMDHNVTFGNVFAHGFKITAVVTVIIIIYTAVAVKFLFPEMQDLALDKTREALAEKNMSDSDTETAINMTKKFFLPFLIGGILFIFMFCGLIASLIGAAAAKKNPQGPFQQTV